MLCCQLTTHGDQTLPHIASLSHLPWSPCPPRPPTKFSSWDHYFLLCASPESWSGGTAPSYQQHLDQGKQQNVLQAPSGPWGRFLMLKEPSSTCHWAPYNSLQSSTRVLPSPKNRTRGVSLSTIQLSMLWWSWHKLEDGWRLGCASPGSCLELKNLRAEVHAVACYHQDIFPPFSCHVICLSPLLLALSLLLVGSNLVFSKPEGLCSGLLLLGLSSGCPEVSTLSSVWPEERIGWKWSNRTSPFCWGSVWSPPHPEEQSRVRPPP